MKLFYLVLMFRVSEAEIINNLFEKTGHICGDNYTSLTTRTRGECILRCSSDGQCIACIYHTTNKCELIYKQEVPSQSVSALGEGARMYVKTEEVGSSYNGPAGFTCTSVGCFHVHYDSGLDWDSANAYCENTFEGNTHLATIDTQEKAYAVATLTRMQSCNTFPAMVGAHDEFEYIRSGWTLTIHYDGVYVYPQTGQEVPAELWDDGEPDLDSGPCAYLNTDNSKFYASECDDHTFNTICEIYV